MYGYCKMYVGLNNGNCDWDNPDWRFQSTGEKWLEASEDDWLKYWSNNGTSYGERPWSKAARFEGIPETGRSLSAVLWSTNHQAIGDRAVPLCQQLK